MSKNSSNVSLCLSSLCLLSVCISSQLSSPLDSLFPLFLPSHHHTSASHGHTLPQKAPLKKFPRLRSKLKNRDKVKFIFRRSMCKTPILVSASVFTAALSFMLTAHISALPVLYPALSQLWCCQNTSLTCIVLIGPSEFIRANISSDLTHSGRVIFNSVQALSVSAVLKQIPGVLLEQLRRRMLHCRKTLMLRERRPARSSLQSRESTVSEHKSVLPKIKEKQWIPRNLLGRFTCLSPPTPHPLLPFLSPSM